MREKKRKKKRDKRKEKQKLEQNLSLIYQSFSFIIVSKIYSQIHNLNIISNFKPIRIDLGYGLYKKKSLGL